MASSVTPPAEDEGAKVDGAVEARGATVFVWGCLGRSCAALRRTIATLMAHMNNEVGRLRIGDRKMAKEPRDRWRKNEFIMGRCILIDIYKGGYKVRSQLKDPQWEITKSEHKALW